MVTAHGRGSKAGLSKWKAPLEMGVVYRGRGKEHIILHYTAFCCTEICETVVLCRYVCKCNQHCVTVMARHDTNKFINCRVAGEHRWHYAPPLSRGQHVYVGRSQSCLLVGSGFLTALTKHSPVLQENTASIFRVEE
jgi:hypothetical protein